MVMSSQMPGTYIRPSIVPNYQSGQSKHKYRKYVTLSQSDKKISETGWWWILPTLLSFPSGVLFSWIQYTYIAGWLISRTLGWEGGWPYDVSLLRPHQLATALNHTAWFSSTHKDLYISSNVKSRTELTINFKSLKGNFNQANTA